MTKRICSSKKINIVVSISQKNEHIQYFIWDLFFKSPYNSVFFKKNLILTLSRFRQWYVEHYNSLPFCSPLLFQIERNSVNSKPCNVGVLYLQFHGNWFHSVVSCLSDPGTVMFFFVDYDFGRNDCFKILDQDSSISRS